MSSALRELPIPARRPSAPQLAGGEREWPACGQSNATSVDGPFGVRRQPLRVTSAHARQGGRPPRDPRPRAARGGVLVHSAPGRRPPCDCARGDVAQLEERRVRIAEARGSSPLISTKFPPVDTRAAYRRGSYLQRHSRTGVACERHTRVPSPLRVCGPGGWSDATRNGFSIGRLSRIGRGDRQLAWWRCQDGGPDGRGRDCRSRPGSDVSPRDRSDDAGDRRP